MDDGKLRKHYPFFCKNFEEIYINNTCGILSLQKTNIVEQKSNCYKE